MNQGMGVGKIEEKVFQILKENLTEEEFRLWIRPISFAKIDNDSREVVIDVPSRFFCDYIDRNYAGIIVKSLQKITGWDSVRVKYRISLRRDEYQTEATRGSSFYRDISPASSPENIPHPFLMPGIISRMLNSNLNPRMTFDTFVAEDNALRNIVTVAKSIAANPQKCITSLVVFYGDFGVGKTHLVNAIGWEIRDKHPYLNVFYTEAPSFRQMVYDSFETKGFSLLLNELKGRINVFILDDIQLLEESQKVQEVLFDLLEFFINQKSESMPRLMVIVSDRHPNNLEKIQERIISRMRGSLLIEVPRPSLVTRAAILRRKLQMANIYLPDDLIDYIARKVDHSARELEGIIASISMYFIVNGPQSLTREEIDRMLNKYSIADRRKVTVDDIIRVVCEYFGVSEKEVCSHTKMANIVRIRHIIMYLARQYLKSSTIEIGEKLGGKDHSSVVYACNNIAKKIKIDKSLKTQVDEIAQKLGLE